MKIWVAASLLFILVGLTACTSPELTAVPAPESAPDRAAKDLDSALDVDGRRIGEPIGHYLHANREALTLQTFGKAYQVERAVQRFAADNEGVFPRYLSDRNLLNKTLIDYLPGKKLLFNAFTRIRTEPNYGVAASQGQVGYAEIHDRQGYLIGFTITAMGQDKDHYLEFNRYMPGRDPETGP